MAITTIGKKIVGYRYGKAPEGGRSWNSIDREWEPGVSMAQVGFDAEVASFAVSGSEARGRFYYIGTICGQGGDDEICLSDVREITQAEYLSLREGMKEVSNQIVNDRINTKIELLNRGYCIGKTIEQLENERQKYLK